MTVDAVILMGIPGAGKSTFFKARFVDTHVRINRDMLGTAHRQRALVEACCAARIPFVLDNTNVAVADRAEVMSQARAARFTVIGYFFESRIQACLERNAARPNPVPEVGVRGRRNALELPRRAEGFDELWYVKIAETGDFTVSRYEEATP